MGGFNMSGYTVTNSIDQIDEYCNHPTYYKTWQLKEAINDAKVHYEFGNATRYWYDTVVRILSSYI